MIALFCGILHIGRSLSQEARLGSAVIGAIAAPMIFEFPFDLIVMTRTYPAVSPDPALYRVLIFAPLFLVEFTTLALLALSPLVRRPGQHAGASVGGCGRLPGTHGAVTR